MVAELIVPIIVIVVAAIVVVVVVVGYKNVVYRPYIRNCIA